MLQYLGETALNLFTSVYRHEIPKPWHPLAISTFIYSSSVPASHCHQTVCLLGAVQKKNREAPQFPLNSWAAAETTSKFSHSWIWWVCPRIEKKKFHHGRHASSRNPRHHSRLSHDNFFFSKSTLLFHIFISSWHWRVWNNLKLCISGRVWKARLLRDSPLQHHADTRSRAH